MLYLTGKDGAVSSRGRSVSARAEGQLRSSGSIGRRLPAAPDIGGFEVDLS